MTTRSGSGRAGGLDHSPVPPPILTAAEGAEFAGSYRSEELDAVYVLAADSGQLVMRRGDMTMPLRRPPGDVLTTGNQTLRFTRDASRRITGFALDAGRVRGITFERLNPP